MNKLIILCLVILFAGCVSKEYEIMNVYAFNDTGSIASNELKCFELMDNEKELVSIYPPLYSFAEEYELICSDNVCVCKVINTNDWE